MTLTSAGIDTAVQILDSIRYHGGGGICPVCRACADHGLAHACITRPGSIEPALTDLPRHAVDPLLRALAAHPAAPVDGTYERRGVDRTWCVCGCTTAGGNR